MSEPLLLYWLTVLLIIPLAADLSCRLTTKDKDRQSSSHTANIGKVTFVTDLLPAEAFRSLTI